MNPRRIPVLLVCLLVGGSARAEEPEIKFSMLLQIWYTQMSNDNLRLDSPAIVPTRYYNLRSEFTENGVNFRRVELKASGRVVKGVEFDVVVDPSLGTGSSNMLQDADIVLKPGHGFDLKLGQFKPLQTDEGMWSSATLIFAERSQIGRIFGDPRDRGLAASYARGKVEKVSARLSAGFFNGAGKLSDQNAQKDFVARLELNRQDRHHFGLYGMTGRTDLPDRGGLVALALAGAGPIAADVLRAKDATSDFGGFYSFRSAHWFAGAEALTAKLGRRFPSLGIVAGNAGRQHLDQRLVGYVVTGTYTRRHHTLALRYDFTDYNSGNRHYTSYDPYRFDAAGAPLDGDYTPRYSEFTAGYSYAILPEKTRQANVKLNYVARSKNFLRPRVGQTGEQGADSLIAAFQVSF